MARGDKARYVLGAAIIGGVWIQYRPVVLRTHLPSAALFERSMYD